MRFRKIIPKAILLVLIFVGIFFRIYNLAWGEPYFFHPDERNIASSITKLSYKENLNPHFFAYGSLPIYSIYFTGVFVNSLSLNLQEESIDKILFKNAILIGRLFSLLFSVLIIFVIYKTTLLLSSKKAAITSSLLSVFSVGYIQYTHFATFEMWLSFLTILLCYFTIKYINENKRAIYLCGIILGILLSVKISSAVYIPLVFGVILFKEFKSFKKDKKINILRDFFYRLVIVSGIIVVILFATSPFYWLDNESFRSSINYESSVALGVLKVFYTQAFENSITFTYQLTKVYPFILNPAILTTAFFAISFLVIKTILKKDISLSLFTLFFLITLFSQTFLYVKWVRYYIPTLSFIYIFIGIFLFEIVKRRKLNLLGNSIFIFLVSVSVLYAFSLFKTNYFDEDTRISAAKWAGQNIERDAVILSEVYDMGIVPFNENHNNIELFNFYELENNPNLVDTLYEKLDDVEYVILPSQRIVSSRITIPDKFPIGNRFYDLLESGNFERVYETPCDIFCKILYLGDPLNRFEQTSNVFDRPHVTIYEKLE